MIPDISKMEPVVCPDCKQQLFVVPLKDQPNKGELGGCKCKRQLFDIPDSVMFGIEGTPLFLFKEKKG